MPKPRPGRQQKLSAIQGVVARYPEQAAIAHSPDALRAIEGSGRVAIILSILNGNLIGKDLRQLDAWHDKGVSIFGFTHAGNNDWRIPPGPICCAATS